jgi:hypothetical protein
VLDIGGSRSRTLIYSGLSLSVFSFAGVQVPAELIQQYYSSLIRSHGGFVQSGPPEKSPFTVFPLEGPVKNRPAKRDSGDENRASGSGSSSAKDEAEEGGGEGMDVDMVKDEIRVRSGETGKTEKEVESLLKEVLRGKERCFYYGYPRGEADIFVPL